MRALFLIVLGLVLASCASTPQLTQRSGAQDAPFILNGRIAISQPARHDSAGLRWTHSAERDEVLLLAPLGQVVARIQGDASGVTLEADGRLHVAADAESLTQEMLGWRLPLSGLRYWVTGVPAPQGRFESEYDAAGRLSRLAQQGWDIRYTRYAGAQRDALPLRLSMQRAGMEVRLVIDEWEMR